MLHVTAFDLYGFLEFSVDSVKFQCEKLTEKEFNTLFKKDAVFRKNILLYLKGIHTVIKKFDELTV